MITLGRSANAIAGELMAQVASRMDSRIMLLLIRFVRLIDLSLLIYPFTVI